MMILTFSIVASHFPVLVRVRSRVQLISSSPSSVEVSSSSNCALIFCKRFLASSSRTSGICKASSAIATNDGRRLLGVPGAAASSSLPNK